MLDGMYRITCGLIVNTKTFSLKFAFLALCFQNELIFYRQASALTKKKLICK